MRTGCYLCILLSLQILAQQNIPTPRWAPGCVLLSASLLCFGGVEQETGEPSNDLYSLQLTSTWNTTEPPWQLTSQPDLHAAYFAIAVLNGHNFLINGGRQNLTSTQSMDNHTWLYNVHEKQWSPPLLLNATAVPRQKHTATLGMHGQIWLWGGSSVPTIGDNHTEFYNTWQVIDTNIWTLLYPVPHSVDPPARVDHTATLIFDTHILIIGGMVYSHDVTNPNSGLTLNPISMSTLLLFDTVATTWRTITAGGNIPAPRGGHSAVLRPGNESVIVFGGATSDNNNTTLNDVFQLELRSMQWIAPTIAGIPPEPRKYHQALLVSADQMLVLFGRGNDQTAYNDVNILSISTWAWESQYFPDLDWLAGNHTLPSHGVTRSNSTVGEAHGNSRNPDSSTTFDNSGDAVGQEGGSSVSSSKITAGVIAGVISAGVVTVSLPDPKVEGAV
ncbi:Acyl-CoA-binding domain-containing protein 5 [Apophysomyces ossiformis]|uniref:Acyl-CoA-binding domain-containing protein 5 n=1 Tax=Apophysomyces ossiformis TaxID=679940 RepID=A0A8H7BIF8_9FUNG|nr:Acyl-CoA-binding domain-containing protein 5 [Apophysomyces ossiformis]